MASKKRKPQKLRQELSEYTSLIRTLHTTSTQDLLPHLTGSFPRLPSNYRSLSAISHKSRSSRDSSTSAGGKDHADESDSNGTRTPKSASSELQDNSTRDIWTRWPLLRASVYVPEWTLQDEVKSIAERAARGWLEAYADDDEDAEAELAKPGSSSPHSSRAGAHQSSSDKSDGALDGIHVGDTMPSTSPQGFISPIDDEAEKVLPLPEEDMLTKGVLGSLHLEASTILSQMFAALAAHRPAVDPGLQNRLRTMDWKAAFNVISSVGIIDESIMQNIQTRLEQVYGKSNNRALERLRVRGAAKRKLQDLDESLESRGDIFHFAHTRKAKRRNSKGTYTTAQKEISSDEEGGLEMADNTQE